MNFAKASGLVFLYEARALRPVGGATSLRTDQVQVAMAFFCTAWESSQLRNSSAPALCGACWKMAPRWAQELRCSESEKT